MDNMIKGDSMRKKYCLLVITVVILLVCMIHFQYGQEITVYGSSIHSSRDYTKVELNIIANKFYIENKERYARKLLKDAENNQLPKIKLSVSNPDEFVFNVYKNDQDKKINKVCFIVVYYRETDKLVLENY